MSTEQPDINNPNLTNWSAYDDFLDDAGKDDRVGKQTLAVGSVTDGIWEKSGEPYREIKGVLSTANNATIDFRLSPPPPPDQLDAMKATMDRNQKQAIARSINMNKQLAQYYGKTYDSIEAGDSLDIEVVKNKEGFVRVVAFLARGSANGTAAAQGSAAGSPGF